MASEFPPKTLAESEDIPLQERGLERLSEEERKLHRLLVPAYKKSAISLSEFEGLYDREMIASDQGYVERKEASFEETNLNPDTAGNLRRAELLEALIKEQVKFNNWLGREAIPITASRYDDIQNGVDMIIEFLREEGVKRLALSVDVTSNSISLEEKLGKIRDSIIRGELTGVRYFKSSDGSRQEIRNVPRVVIGTDAKTIRELSFTRLELHALAKNFDKNKKSGLSQETIDSLRTRIREARLKIARHRVQLLILNEIELQILTFIRFAEKNKRPEIVLEYQKALEIIRTIKRAKTDTADQRGVQLTPKDEFANNNDGVYGALLLGLKIFE